MPARNDTELVIDGDTAIAVVYRLTDSDGRIWRSSPYILPDSLDWEGLTDFRVRIPTLRHLMAGTTAEIELYIGQVDLQLFRVYANNPGVNYIDVYPCELAAALTGTAFGTIKQAVSVAGVGETLYTTGGALENAAPPIARCAYTWRNRAFVANGSTIYPSQEFAEGLGIAWNEITRVHWLDGTGDILAMCHIDWNYLAIFKRDAIGIISGPGPDGMGSGNYIVQTLSTKAGCVNIKSIVNGADGVYYQDSQTGRLMLLSSDLQVKECAPGAFDLSANAITCSLHVEQARQLWFYAASGTGAVGSLIVLDYKHRTAACPCGSVYTWTAFDVITGMAIICGTPTLILGSGATAVQVANQWQDITAAASAVPICILLCTADISPLGLQREFNLCKIQLLGEYRNVHDVTITASPDFAATSVSNTKLFTAFPEQLQYRPASCQRIQAVRIQVAESVVTAGTPPVPVASAGCTFVGLGLVVQDYGKFTDLSTGRIM